MVIVGLLLGSIGIALLWPTRSKRVTLAGALAALLLSALVAALLTHVANMPRETSVIAGQVLQRVPRPLVARDDELLLLDEDELIAVRLPSGQIDARLAAEPKGRRFVVSAVSARGAVVFSYLRASLSKGWAFVPRDRSRVDWHEVVTDRAPPRAYWDGARDRFVLVEERADPLDVDQLELVLTPIDLDGQLGKPERFRVRLRELPVAPAVCSIGDQLYAAGSTGVCLFAAPDADGIRRCAPQPIRAACPGSLDAEATLAWLGETGPVPAPALPPAFSDATLTGRHLVLGPDGMAPGGQWISEDLARLFLAGRELVRIDRISPEESARAGQMREEHALIELFSADGARLGSVRLLRPPSFWFVARSGSELVLLSGSLDRVARFNRTTLERVDEPDHDPAWLRLAIWGGRSRLYEVAATFVIYGGGALLLVLIAFHVPRPRTSARAWTVLRRASAIFAALALIVLSATLQRMYYL